MSANDDLERRIADFYATEVVPRTPGRVLQAALETVDATPQRRAHVRVPWRFPRMNRPSEAGNRGRGRDRRRGDGARTAAARPVADRHGHVAIALDIAIESRPAPRRLP